MLSEWLLLRRFLWGRPLQSSLAILVMALSVAISVTMLLLSSGIHSSLVQAATPFPMLMGAKGSPNQLVLNSVFLKDQPIGNFSYSKLTELRQNKNVAQAVPLGYGDNYRGFRIVGTEPEIFTFRGINNTAGSWLNLATGKTFSAPYEAVLGADVAAKTGLKLGDSFASVHGVVQTANSKSHKEQYKVVGILKPVQGPYDSAILVSLDSIWHAHEHNDDITEPKESTLQHKEQGKEITAVLIRPAGYAQSMQLAASYAKDRDVQLIFPSKTIIQLFTILGNLEGLLQAFSIAALILALIIIGSSLYWYILGSLRQQGILRALGASSSWVSRFYFQLGLMLVAGGLGSGLILGHGLYAALGILVQAQTGLNLQAKLLPAEAALAIGVLVCGAAFSWLAVRLAMRNKDIVEIL